jgi:hypothetical protein
MILVSMGKHDAENIAALFDQITDVRKDQVNAGQFGPCKRNADIDDHPRTAALAAQPVQGEVHTDLASAGATVSPESLFASLTAKMMGRLAQWNSGEHFSTIRTDWLARAAGLGETMRVRVADKDIVGNFETIDDTGRLVLVAADGARETIAAGDVVTLDAAGLSSSRAPNGQS